MRTLLLCAIFCGIAAGLAMAADQPAAAAPAAASAKALKIGYVDINQALMQYERRNDLDKELQGLQDKMREQARVRLNEVDKLSKSVEQLAMGTPERAALQEKLKSAEDDLAKFRSASYDEMTQAIVERMNKLYDDITTVTVALGNEKGYDFILKDQSPAPVVESRGEAAVQISQRVVMYAKPEYDLTSEVAKRLNDAYARKNAQPRKSEPPDGTSEKK